MRKAAAALTTEQTPPPADPRQYWKPFIYTFSTGDPVTGGVVTHANQVSFRRLPYEIGPDGRLRGIPRPPNSPLSEDDYHAGTPVTGKIYKYEGEDKVDEREVPPNSPVDLFTFSF